MRRAWFLNLDGELELDAQGFYQPKRHILARVLEHADTTLLTQGEPVLDREAPQPFGTQGLGTLGFGAHGFGTHDADIAVCWCPTPGAQRLLTAAGWPTPKAPSADIVRAVNHRRFLLPLLPREQQRHWVADEHDLVNHDISLPWRLKRPLGFAGRGQRVIREGRSKDDERWIENSLRTGFSLERDVVIDEEWCIHGYVDADGELLGRPCRQIADAYGSVSHCEIAPCPFEALLVDAAHSVAAALCNAGYFGPFGLDAFSYFEQGELRFNPMSDLNARFTMFWSLGMGDDREAALARHCGQ